MKQVSLIHNAIVGGTFYTAGAPIDLEILPQNLRKYIAKPSQQSAPLGERHLNFSLNESYSVDSEGYLRGSPSRQAAQMEAEAAQEDLISDELAEAEPSAEVAAAIEEARQDYQADLEGAKLQAKVKAEGAEQAVDSLREEHDAAVENQEFDQWNAEALRQAAPASEKAVGPPAPANSKLKVKGKRSFIRRDGRFVLASGRQDLIIGEILYRYRPKSFGVAESYIAFGKVRKETS